MIDIDYTLLVQLANFIVLIFVLNVLLIKPMMKHLAERDDKISSSHGQAKANMEKAESMLAEYEAGLADARMKANQAYTAVQQEGIAQQRAKLVEAREKAQEMMGKAMAELDSEAGKARKTLETEMAKLPADIASKLLGRAI